MNNLIKRTKIQYIRHKLEDADNKDMFGIVNSLFKPKTESLPSSSSCHQTAVFHCSTHCFAISLNYRGSSQEQECARSGNSNICLVFSDKKSQSHVVSPS